MDAFKQMLIAISEAVFSVFGLYMDLATGVLTQKIPFTDGVISMAKGLVTPIATTIIAMCLLIELAQVAMKVDALKWETALKLGVKAALSVAAVNIAPDLLEAIFLQTGSWISEMADWRPAAIEFAEGSETIGRVLAGITGYFVLLFAGVFVLLAFLVVFVSGMSVAVNAIGRLFEIYVLIAVSPIPVAFFPLGDGSGGGISRVTGNFFRYFASVCLHGLMIVIIVQVYMSAIHSVLAGFVESGSFSAGSVADLFLLLSLILMGPLCVAFTVGKAGKWAKQVLNVS